MDALDYWLMGSVGVILTTMSYILTIPSGTILPLCQLGRYSVSVELYGSPIEVILAGMGGILFTLLFYNWGRNYLGEYMEDY